MPISVKLSFRDAAAKTVIVPVAAELLAAGDDELLAGEAELELLLLLLLLLLEQPATAITAIAAMMRA